MNADFKGGKEGKKQKKTWINDTGFEKDNKTCSRD